MTAWTERIVGAALVAAVGLAGCARKEPVQDSRRGKVSAEIADQGPRLVGNPPTVQIELPPRMTQALAAADSGYTTLSPADFASAIVPGRAGTWSYPYDGNQAPFAVLGDFDGDRRKDVALLQRSPDRGRVAVVFDLTDGPRVAIAKTWNRSAADDKGGSRFYLLISREIFVAPSGARAITLGNWGKPATTFSWMGETFSVDSGDSVRLKGRV